MTWQFYMPNRRKGEDGGFVEKIAQLKLRQQDNDLGMGRKV